MKRLGLYVITMGTFFFAFTAIVIFLSDWYEAHMICKQTKRVAEIGQCDLEGYCDVTFYDGSQAEAIGVRLGQEICTRGEFEWKR
jgi:hypothetical protein